MFYGKKYDHYGINKDSGLGNDLSPIFGPDLGEFGKNLTIHFLSLERSELSVRLLTSIAEQIPNFEGQVLVTDNGSALEVREVLNSTAKNLKLNVVIQELGVNHGVAGGRNKGLEQVKTDWVMFLDNDIYFKSNPISDINSVVNSLNSSFINIPLLDSDAQTIFALGGQLFFHNGTDGIYVGGGSAINPKIKSDKIPSQPFLSSFLFGGASVVRKTAFLAAGGFDPGMFIGFEDIDFSLTLSRMGFKIANLVNAHLVHDHRRPVNKADIDYERIRFSKEMLQKSAEYFQNKNGLRVWNDGVENWLAQREAELGITSQDSLGRPGENENNFISGETQKFHKILEYEQGVLLKTRGRLFLKDIIRSATLSIMNLFRWLPKGTKERVASLLSKLGFWL